eukprot:g5838.t1
MSDLDWVDGLKVVELRKRLKDLGENSTGKKAVLVDRLKLKLKLKEETTNAEDEASPEDENKEASPVTGIDAEDKKEGGLDALLGDGEDDLEFDFETEKPSRKKQKLDEDTVIATAMDIESNDNKDVTPEGAVPATKDANTAPTEFIPESATQQTEEEIVVPEVKEEDRTRALHIANFVRPFTEKAAKEMLSEYGTIEEMWMPNIKTHCYVLYESKECAHQAYLSTYKVVWPRNGNRLISKYVSEEEAKKAIEEGKTQTSLGRSSGAAPYSKPRPAPSTSQDSRVATKPALSLEDLFCKTEAKPHIYYLPLTDEQVEAKKRADEQEAPRGETDVQPSGDVTGE